MSDRPAICYAAPGHTLLASAGSTRNILAAAEALSEWVDVTVAFRSIAEQPPPGPYEVVAIESPESGSDERSDDVAARGLNPLHHLRHVASVRRFAQQRAGRFDLVLEKGWRLSGLLSREIVGRGGRAVLIENDARLWDQPRNNPRAWARYLLHVAAQQVAGFCSRQAPLIIAETEQLRQALIMERSIAAEKIKVVELGVDHAMFRPLDQRAARAALGFDQDPLIMLYVGGMDQYHDLSPLLSALQNTPGAALELHLVGDGEYRQRYEELAAGVSARVVFHGQIEHRSIPEFTAAADVCLAPYNTRGFHNGQVYFATLKIPEYMACERPVISVPSGHILDLITAGETGFLFANDVAAWRGFLSDLPSREMLGEMGRRAGPAVASLSWQATARGYLDYSGLPGVVQGADLEAAAGRVSV